MQQYGVTSTHMQCLECSASTSNKPFSVCHNVSGDTVVPQLLRYRVSIHAWCLLSHLRKGACFKCLQCMSVVPAVMWCNKCTFQDDLVSFVSLVCSACGVFGYLRVSRNLSPVVAEVSLVIWGSGFLLQILSHAQFIDKLWLNGKPGFRGRCEVSSYLQSCC